LPVTTVRVELEPCMDPKEQSATPNAQFYGPEVMNKTGCTVEMNT